MLSHEIRETFQKFFEARGHHRVASSSLVPHDDPTLLFVNAGMVPFKETFIGNVKRDYTRATSCQRCVRAGGKHNDLEEVGYTKRHHTMFEMLGNFSFGDYFKEEAIAFAWELVTKELSLDVNRLYVSVFEEDDEAHGLWKKLGVSESRIYRFGEKDNFWAMGDTGPCGPCSELFFDLGEEAGNGPEDVMGGEGDRFLEFYNLVFMQYEQRADGSRVPLPKPSIDTGMGLERISTILQGKVSNYDTDGFLQIISSIESKIKSTDLNQEQRKIACQVIADHIRTATLLIGDGVLPSNLGRGYVLRRVLRRAIRYSYQLGFQEPTMHELVPLVIELLGTAHPIFQRKEASVKDAVELEEKSFLRTVHKGLNLLDEERSKIDGKVLSGDVAFKLYDTFGFPKDLTAVILKDQGMSYDGDRFDELMEQQRERARANAKFGTEGDWSWTTVDSTSGESSQFHGYTELQSEASIVKYATEANSELLKIVLDRTPFYAESGGQVGDKGFISSQNMKLKVFDTQKEEGEIVHLCELVEGNLQTDGKVVAAVDEKLREETIRNHTAVHMLQGVLREKFGESIQQAGSYVDHERFRFDFTFNRGLSKEEVRDVEQELFRRLNSGNEVVVHHKSLEDARKMGALCPFGEKYADEVRVIDIPGMSMEFCGGTHVSNISEIGMIKIVSESSISAGVRRIEGVTAANAFELFQSQDQDLDSISRTLKQKEGIPQVIEEMQSKLKASNKELMKLREELQQIKMENLYKDLPKIKEMQYLQASLEGVDAKSFRSLSDTAIQKIGSGTLILFNTDKEKVSLICKVSDDWVEKGVDANKIVGELAPIVGGRGGGRKNMAQAGGNEPQNVAQAMEKTPQLLAGLLD